MHVDEIEFRSSDGLKLVAHRWGDPGDHPVLLLHGGGQSRHAWRATGQRLAALGLCVIAPDARGHGDSEWSATGDYDMHTFARDVLALLGTLPQRPAVVGASMGGMSALLAQRLSEAQLFSSVVLVDVTPRMDLGGVARIVSFMTAHPEGFASLDEAADAIAAYNPHRQRSTSSAGLERALRRRPDRRWSWRWDPAFVSWRRTVGPEGAAALESRMDAMADELYEGAQRITAPILLVRGQHSDLVSEEVVAEFRRRLPHASYIDVGGAGHMVAGDDNDAFTDAVSGFLRSTLPSPRCGRS